MRALLLSIVLLSAAVPLSAATGRVYDLNTLDHPIASGLVTDICTQQKLKPQDCRVQNSSPGHLSVYADWKIHAQIVRMLADRDPRLPPSLTYQIVLVKAGSDGQPIASLAVAAHVKRALEGAQELLSLEAFEVIDQGLVHMSDSGSTRLKGSSSRPYLVFLSHRGAVTDAKGTHITLELEVGQAAGEAPAESLLTSVLTLEEGETVIAGTSALATGNAALLVILTSVEL